MHPEHELLIALARILQSPYTHLKDLADSAEGRLKTLVAPAAGAAADNPAPSLQALADHVTGGLTEKLIGEIAQLKADIAAGLAVRFKEMHDELQTQIGGLKVEIDQLVETKVGALVAAALAAEAAPPAPAA